MNLEDVIPAPLLVLAAAVCTQSGQALGKSLFDRLDPLGVVSLRLGIAALVVMLLYRPFSRPRTLRQAATVAGLGVAIAGMNLIYPALQYLPLGVASTIQLMGPLAVAVAGSRRVRDLTVVALAAAGLWLVRDPASGPLHWQGLLLAGLSAVAMGCYLLLSRALAGDLGHSALALALPAAACLGLPAGLASDGAILFQPQILAWGVVVAVLSAVVPYSLEMAALKHISTTTAGILLSLEPVIAAVAGLLVLGETLSTHRWLGIVCICTATAVAVRHTAQSEAGRRPVVPDPSAPRRVSAADRALPQFGSPAQRGCSSVSEKLFARSDDSSGGAPSYRLNALPTRRDRPEGPEMTIADATATFSADATYRPGKIRNRVLWTLQIVLGLFFIIASGGPKLVMPNALTENAVDALTFPFALLIFIGIVEVAGGIGLMVPRLSALAAAGLSVLTVLAAGTQAFLAGAPAMAIFPLVLAAIFAWIAYERRATVAELRDTLAR